MTHVLRIAHLRIAHQVANPEVGKREGNLFSKKLPQKQLFGATRIWIK